MLIDGCWGKTGGVALAASVSSGGSQMKSKVPQKGLNYIEQQQIKRLYEIGRHREAAAQTALMICCIVLNKQHNFGRDRLKALADEVNSNIKEFYADPEAGCYNIKRAMEQIGFDDNIGDIMDTLAVHDDLKAKLSRIKK